MVIHIVFLYFNRTHVFKHIFFRTELVNTGGLYSKLYHIQFEANSQAMDDEHVPCLSYTRKKKISIADIQESYYNKCMSLFNLIFF